MPPKQKPPTPPSTTQQLAELLNTLLTNLTITEIYGDTQPHTPSMSTPPSLLNDVKSIKATLVALQKVITPSVQAGKPPQSKNPESAPSAPPPRAKGKNPPIMFASAAASPPRPSIMVSLAHLTWKEGKPSPADLCARINQAMEASDNDQVHISAARWTARENMILTGGPNTTAHHLQQATHTILAFEDPDSSHAHDLLTKKVFYVFGHCATLRKWKQHPTNLPPHTTPTNNESNPNTKDMSDIDKAIMKAVEVSAHTPYSEGPETSKTMKGDEDRQRAGGGKGGIRPLERCKPR
ncbi:hypothetical protein EI94DRAFT_1708917 [Lactarius quietus]|nr:hypothetical protein EI94DRAFT_1708917 [Lactarius quietus]